MTKCKKIIFYYSKDTMADSPSIPYDLNNNNYNFTVTTGILITPIFTDIELKKSIGILNYNTYNISKTKKIANDSIKVILTEKNNNNIIGNLSFILPSTVLIGDFYKPGTVFKIKSLDYNGEIFKSTVSIKLEIFDNLRKCTLKFK